MVGGLVAEYHGELDRERGQVDRPGWRRLQQGHSVGRTADKTGVRRLLQRDTANSGE